MKYIGKRVIPQPEGNWDNTRSYEVLSIVLAENGNGYISKKDVPVGIELSNEEYWTIIYNFSSDNADMRQKINEFSENVTDVTSRITEVEKEMEETKQTLGESVADGKALIASAITSQGVSTPDNSTWQELHDNVLALSNAKTILAGINFVLGYDTSMSKSVTIPLKGFTRIYIKSVEIGERTMDGGEAGGDDDYGVGGSGVLMIDGNGVWASGAITGVYKANDISVNIAPTGKNQTITFNADCDYATISFVLQ